MLSRGTFESADEEQKFADYYNRSLFPNVTNPANRLSPRDDVIAKLRNDLRACERPQEKQVFDKLVELGLDYMSKVAKDDQYHPVARLNAMLAIGEINAPVAARALLDAAFNRNQIFAVRIAAMSGLIRMAGPSGRRVLLDAEIEPLVVKRMTSFVGYVKAKKDDGIYWMRGQAADVLGELGEIGPQGEIPPALLTMINDKDLPIPLRTKAAKALGKLNYGDNTPAARPYLMALAALARDTFSSEQPADRGRVRQVLRDVEEGVKKFGPSANDQVWVDSLKKTLQTLNKETEDKMTPEQLKASLAKASASLESLLNKKS